MLCANRSAVLAAVGLLVVASLQKPACAETPRHDSSRWKAAMAAFEKQDRAAPPAEGGVVFVGSSSIRLWDLAESFPDLKPLNRGFGGSQIADAVHFADLLVLRHKPRVVVMYAGDNDIAAGKTPEQVAADFAAFVMVVHQALPETKIVYLSIKPSGSRWKLVESIRAANRLIEAHCRRNEKLAYVDLFAPMLGEDGRPRPELYAKDQLHLSPAGYRLWTERVAPLLTPEP